MSGAINAIAGVAEITVGAFLEDVPGFETVGTALILAGAAQLLGFAVSLLISPRRAPLIAVGANYAGTLERPTNAPETLDELTAVYLVR